MLVKNKDGRYELENGGFLTSPSRILRPLTFEKYKDIPTWQLEKAAEFGKEIHEAIEIYHILDDEQEVRHLLYTKRHNNVFDQYLNWIRENKIKVLEVEKLVYSEADRFYGYIDLVCEIDNETYIVDVKIRSNLKSDDDFMVERLQNELYGFAYTEMFRIQPKKALLIINKNTKNQRLFFEKEPSINEIWLLRSLMLVQHYQNEIKQESEDE